LSQTPMKRNNKYAELDSDQVREKVVRYLVRGNAMEEIATKMNLSVEYVVTTWKDYVSSQYAMPEEERWLLHERRLEYMLQKATKLIEEGLDAEFGAQTLQAALKVLQQLEELQGLNNARKKEAENKAVELTQKQVAQMLEIIDNIKQELSYQLVQELQQLNSVTPDIIQGQFEEVQLKVIENAG